MDDNELEVWLDKAGKNKILYIEKFYWNNSKNPCSDIIINNSYWLTDDSQAVHQVVVDSLSDAFYDGYSIGTKKLPAPSPLPALGLPGMSQIVIHPVANIRSTLFEAIISLNDIHRWTREEIADWLDTLDNQPTF